MYERDMSQVRKAEKHQISKKTPNKESFHMLGKNRIEHSISESRRLTAINHNKQSERERMLLNTFVRESSMIRPFTVFGTIRGRSGLFSSIHNEYDLKANRV
ncbi:hypothetical protein QTP88_021550 [Uroleucon formosanum]